MSRDLVIMGAGDLAREVAFLIRELNRSGSVWNLLGFVVEEEALFGSVVDGYPVIGGTKALVKQGYSGAAAIAAANPVVAWRIREQIKAADLRLSFPSLLHPTVVIDPDTFSLEEGVIVFGGCVISTNVTLGSFTFVNSLCSIGHDVTTGKFCRIMPDATILGAVSLARGVYIGASAVIMEYKQIGEGAQVSMGAVVSTDVAPWTVVGGNPARVIKKLEPWEQTGR